MPLGLDITRAWESTNDSGGALAEALQAIREGEDIDRIGKALIQLEDAKRTNLRAAGQIQLVIDDASKLIRSQTHYA